MTNTNASMLLKFLISGNRGVCLGHAAAPRQHHFVDCHLEILSNSANDSMTLSLPIFLGPTGLLVCWLLHVLISCRPCHAAWLSDILYIYSHYSLKFERIRHWNDIRSVRLCRTSDPSWWPREFHCGCCAATSYTWQETLPSCHFCKRQMSKFDLELSWI